MILISNIIITNKNKTAIAPTYIIKKSKAKNSHSNKNSNPDAEIKLKTKKSTEWIELFDIIIHKELINKKKENITKSNFST